MLSSRPKKCRYAIPAHTVSLRALATMVACSSNSLVEKPEKLYCPELVTLKYPVYSFAAGRNIGIELRFEEVTSLISNYRAAGTAAEVRYD